MKPVFVSSGEPAGIGPDLCLALAEAEIPLVVAADPAVIEARARQLNKPVRIEIYHPAQAEYQKDNRLWVLPFSCPAAVQAGKLDERNASYVLDILSYGIDACANQQFSALLTAPVHKGIINAAGYPFSGHTEFLAEKLATPSVVMLLANPTMRVALVTTHLPLSAVPAAITAERVTAVIRTLYAELIDKFNIQSPHIRVAGLNPHAGESGYLGREEIEIIAPALERLRQEGMNIEGPLSADTMFLASKQHSGCDAYLAMYHDQGLPVLKYSGFGSSANISLGLPIIRTSVDHGTALDKAGTGMIDYGSMRYALEVASEMAVNKELSSCQK